MDMQFGVHVANCYRLKRKVEMYQWFERTETQEINGEMQTVITYDKDWFEYPIDSQKFARPENVSNPTQSWPYKSKTYEAKNVTMGMFRLNEDQIARLGETENVLQLRNDGSQIVMNTWQTMNEAKFKPFTLRGSYFYSSVKQKASNEAHIGQYRVQFSYDACGPATIIGQQITDEEDMYTFRRWSQEKKYLPFGQRVDLDNEALESGKCFNLSVD